MKGLEEKGRDIEKLNDDLMESINRELNNEINNVMVPYFEEKMEGSKNDT